MRTPCLYLLLLLAGLSWPARPVAAAPATLRGRPAGTLDAAPTSLAGFTTALGTPSAPQVVIVNGTGLTGDVTATVSSGYEISWTQSAYFGQSITLTAAGGFFTNVPLYVRLTGAAVGPLAGTVSISNAAVTTQTVTLAGTVTATATPNPASTVTSHSPTTGVGGTTITMHFYGQNFVPGALVSLQANSRAYVSTFISSSHITALVELPSVGASTYTYFYAGNPLPVSGTNGGGMRFFTITPGPPTITWFEPTSGPVGTRVRIHGTNMDVGGTDLRFNGTPAQLAASPSPTLLMASVPTGATTGLLTLTGLTGAAVSALPFVVTPSVYEDFEQGSKTSYAAASVLLRSGGWTLRETLLGTTAGADKFNGAQSARLRGGGSLEMDTDKPGGAGVVTVSAALYATETGVSFIPEISTDGGITYTSLLGSTAPPVLTGTLTAYSFTANRSGPVRLRFSSTNAAATTNPRFNLDDVGISNYSPALATAPGPALATLAAYPNPARNHVALTAAADEVQLLDLLGRPLAPGGPLAAGQALPLTWPAGLYLLRVRSGDYWRTLRLRVE